MGRDTDPGRDRGAEIRGGDAPDFAAMTPQEPPPDLEPEPGLPEPGPEDGS